MGEETNKSVKDWRPTSDPRIKRRYDGQLYARFSKFGLRIEQRLHETNMAGAVKAVDLIESHLRDGKKLDDIKAIFKKSLKDQPKNAVLICELWSRFFDYRQHGDQRKKLKPWRQKTLIQYAGFWDRSFESFWGNHLPEDIEKLWPKFLTYEQARRKQAEPISFEHHIKYFSTFVNWLVENGHLKTKPLLYDPNWVATESEEDTSIVYTDEQVREMVLESDGPFHLYVLCAAYMGMRSSEITQLAKDRIHIDKKVIKLRASDVKTGSKTNKGRTIPIHPEVYAPLVSQIKTSGKSPFLFPNRMDISRPMDPTGFKKPWHNMMTKLKYEGTPHCLRHTYATKVFSNPKINQVLAAKALGMSMQTAERVYIHFTDDQFSQISRHFEYNSDVLGTGLGLEKTK